MLSGFCMRPFILFVSLVALPCLAAPLDEARLARLFGFSGKQAPTLPVEVPTTPLPFRLLGTLCGERSLAAVATDLKTYTVSVGDFVLGVEIVSIEQRQVGVRRSASIEFLGFSLVAPSRIETSSPGRLARSVLLQQIANPAQIIASVRLVPAMAEGRVSGFKAISVAAGSLAESLGLRRGDTLRAVNGVRLDNPSQLMTLYSQLSSTRRFDVELERDGKITTQSLAIDD